MTYLLKVITVLSCIISYRWTSFSNQIIFLTSPWFSCKWWPVSLPTGLLAPSGVTGLVPVLEVLESTEYRPGMVSIWHAEPLWSSLSILSSVSLPQNCCKFCPSEETVLSPASSTTRFWCSVSSSLVSMKVVSFQVSRLRSSSGGGGKLRSGPFLNEDFVFWVSNLDVNYKKTRGQLQ